MPIARYDARLLPKQLTAAPGGSGLASRRGPYFAGMQGRVPRGSPHSERPRLCLPACLYSSLRCEAAAQAAYRRARQLQAGLSAGPYLARVQGCVHVTHAARQARGGLGLASRPAHNALRWEDRCPGSSPPHDAAPGWPLGPALTLLERSGLGAAFRHAYIDSSPRSKAAAQAAHRRAMRPRARLSAGPYILLECKAVTTRLAKLSGL